MEDEQKPDFAWGQSEFKPVTIVVEYGNGQVRRFPAHEGWRVENLGGVPCIIINRGVFHTYVPLPGGVSFDLVHGGE